MTSSRDHSASMREHTLQTPYCRLSKPCTLDPPAYRVVDGNILPPLQMATTGSVNTASSANLPPLASSPIIGVQPSATNAQSQRPNSQSAAGSSGGPMDLASCINPQDLHDFQGHQIMQDQQQPSGSGFPYTPGPMSTGSGQASHSRGSSAGVPSVTASIGDTQYINGQIYSWDGFVWQWVGQQVRR